MLIALELFIAAHCTLAQTTPMKVPSSSALKKMSVEELMDIQITSVSRKAEKLSETASAIQVITEEDIRRSGATSLPEALRLASNLQVAQVNSRQWAISARGFNNTAANKMLVLIDGRTVYTPLHSGVFWDVQDTLLADLDRIEVISGPGATLWGANAVNGVINVITKNARDTQGLLVESGGGSQLRALTNVRYGAGLGSNAHYRVYGKFFSRDSTTFPNGRDADNNWKMGQGGFRFDWDKSQHGLFTLQGDFYLGEMDQLGSGNTKVKGGNFLGRWSQTLSNNSDLSFQFYYDRTNRSIVRVFSEDLSTFDLDFQHHLQLGKRSDIVWGLGYRQMKDNIHNGPALAFLPPQLTRRWYSGFVQGEVALIKERLSLTLGTKIEHNDYTGFEFQPSTRLSWRINHGHMAWGAISRAVRTPSRLDRELFIPGQPPFLLAGGPNFKSEELVAYELGYRTHSFERLSLSVSTFYNNYDNLRSVEQINPPVPVPVFVGNGLKGESYGVELSADYQVTRRWQLRAGFTEMRIHIRPDATSTDRTGGSGESHNPNRHFLLRSSFELPGNLEFDSALRAVSRIANQRLPGYAELDLRLAWQPKPSLEFSMVGQNLLHDQHAEFGSPAARQEIKRSLHGKIVWRFLKQ